jgi:acyl carrier protein
MKLNDRTKVRAFVGGLLHNRGAGGDLADSDSLFVSGRLESIAAVEVVCFLESEFGVDFTDVDFEISIIDSVDRIAALAEEHRP